MAANSNSSVPSFKEQGDEIPLVCPVCRHEVIPANASEAEDAAISTCKHVVLQHLWGFDPDISTPDVRAWWESMAARRLKLEEGDGEPETLYRECPCLDHVVEYRMWWSPGTNRTATFGFKS